MRIALVAHHVRPGGGQDRYLLELARHLSRSHEVHLVVIAAEGCEGLGVAVHRVHVPARPVLWMAPRFARRAGHIVRQLSCDITHGVGGSMPGANVVTAQYVHAAWHEAAERFGVREPTLLRRVYQRRVGRQSEHYDRETYAASSLRQVIAVSRRTGAELERHYQVPRERIAVIPNGVDPGAFNASAYPEAAWDLRRSLSLPASAMIALLIGTYVRKGLETAIHAVKKTGIEDLHLVVAGAGDAEQAHAWAAAAGMGERLHLLGPRDDPERLFAASDVFVLPTRYEPFGMVIVEAMASGLPVVVSETAGAAELIRHGENGFLVAEPDDIDGFADGIRAALTAAPALGRSARSTAMSVAWPRIAELTEATYHRALARP